MLILIISIFIVFLCELNRSCLVETTISKSNVEAYVEPEKEEPVMVVDAWFDEKSVSSAYLFRDKTKSSHTKLNIKQ